MRNKLKIGDWEMTEKLYADLNQVVTKNAKVVLDDRGTPPRVYLKCVTELEDLVMAAWSGRKSISKLKAKALTNLKQGIKRYNREQKYEEALAAYRENPGDEPAEAEAAEKDKTEKVSAKAKVTKAPPTTAAKFDKSAAAAGGNESGGDESGSESDWGSDDSDSDSGDEDVGDGTFRWHASMFLKKNDSGEKEKSAKDLRQEENARKSAAAEEAARAAADADDGFSEVGKQGKTKKDKKAMFAKGEEVTIEACLEKLQEFIKTRGKRGTKIREQMGQLRALLVVVQANNLGVGLIAKISLEVIATHFDSANSVAGFMDDAAWRCCHDDLVELLNLLRDSPNLKLQVDLDNDNEVLEGPELKVRGDVVSFIERLDSENIKSLQETDPHSNEYVERLKNEVVVYNLICRAQQHVTPSGDMGQISRVMLRRLEHIYYKRNYLPNLKHLELTPEADAAAAAAAAAAVAAISGEAVSEKEAPNTTALPPRAIPVAIDLEEEKDSTALVFKLCCTLHDSRVNSRIRTRAMLCHIYHHALHDRWFKARDLMLMSHLQELITTSDIETQILYNRTMVQLGLCAFRHGLIQEAHTALHDIWAGSRVKELLAQGIVNMRNQEKSAEELQTEKRRQTPFHMHINIEMMECVYYICSMLMEIPIMAQGIVDKNKRRFFSKPFRRQLDFYRRNTFTGPPENARDHVMAASLAMKSGDWRKTLEFIMQLRIWGLFPDKDKVLDMLEQKVKEESLRTYLFAYSGVYKTISLDSLAKMFDLPTSTVHSLVSKMIISEELQASHDQPTQTIEIHVEEPSLLQNLAMQFADKAGLFVENNERMMDYRLSSKDGLGRGRGRGRGGRGRGESRGSRGSRVSGRGWGGRGGYAFGSGN